MDGLLPVRPILVRPWPQGPLSFEVVPRSEPCCVVPSHQLRRVEPQAELTNQPTERAEPLRGPVCRAALLGWVRLLCWADVGPRMTTLRYASLWAVCELILDLGEISFFFLPKF